MPTSPFDVAPEGADDAEAPARAERTPRDSPMPSIRKTWWSALTVAALAVGCTGEEPAKTDSAPTPTPAPAAADPAPKTDAAPPAAEAPKADAPKAEAVKLTEDELAEIKKLPADEQDAALKQAVCPVSGEHLGSMALPIKVSAEGKTFYLCCKGCQKEVESDPKGVVAKLSAK